MHTSHSDYQHNITFLIQIAKYLQKKFPKKSAITKKVVLLQRETSECSSYLARVAELVDAMVSKTIEVTLVPVRFRPRVLRNIPPIYYRGFFLCSVWKL